MYKFIEKYLVSISNFRKWGMGYNFAVFKFDFQYSGAVLVGLLYAVFRLVLVTVMVFIAKKPKPNSMIY
jgi:miniconductance mechanosensitive channel